MNVADFNVNFRRHFPQAPYCLDVQSTVAFGKPWTARIDIVKLDDWLHRQMGPYEKKGLSMREAIIKKFGKRAAAFVMHALTDKQDEKEKALIARQDEKERLRTLARKFAERIQKKKQNKNIST